MASGWHSIIAGGSKDPGLSNTKESKTPIYSLSPSDTNNPDPAQTQPEFIVEEITGKRYVNGRVEMQIKWKDFPPESSSWEPLENLGNCILLVADFEAKLFRMKEMARSGSKKKVGKEPTAMKASLAPAPGEREPGTKSIDKKTPKSTPHPNTGLQIGGNQKEGKPIKLRPALHLLLSDNEVPSTSFGHWANPTPSDREISARPFSSAASSASSISSGSNSQLLNELRTLSITKPPLKPLNSQKEKAHQPQPEAKAATKKMQKNLIPAATENPIDMALSDIRNMQLVEKGPKVQILVQGPKKSKKITKQTQEQESSDEDPETPSMTPWETVFGLARGLELDKVVNSFHVYDRHFLFVTWKGIDAVDTVPMEELKEAYPAQVLEYFEKVERRYN
ncbi:chromo domain-containing protein rhino-like [Drosophila kikkawai]|uniref:Chromo domain-containing protein rhino-like n=1 Tax=Drosophila kikkawai TaxID=30033 RepID=A0A6P4I6N6_DROKI|nr:uncharacterized protein LOC108075766 [Drosophila kikkawai]